MECRKLLIKGKLSEPLVSSSLNTFIWFLSPPTNHISNDKRYANLYQQ